MKTEPVLIVGIIVYILAVIFKLTTEDIAFLSVAFENLWVILSSIIARFFAWSPASVETVTGMSASSAKKVLERRK